jgi:hypothetical protein
VTLTPVEHPLGPVQPVLTSEVQEKTPAEFSLDPVEPLWTPVELALDPG